MIEMVYCKTMNILRQLGIILAFSFAGDLIARYIPLGLPGTVSGMLLVLLALSIKVLQPRHIDQTADFLSANLAFFLIPAAVRIVRSYNYIQPVLLKLFLVCVISTIVTFAAAYGIVRLTQIVLKKGKGV